MPRKVLTGVRPCRQGLCGYRKPVRPFNLCSNTISQAGHTLVINFTIPTAPHAPLRLSDSEALLGTYEGPEPEPPRLPGFRGTGEEGKCYPPAAPVGLSTPQRPLSVRILHLSEPSRLRLRGSTLTHGAPSTLREILMLKLFAAYQKFKPDGCPLDRNSAAPSTRRGVLLGKPGDNFLRRPHQRPPRAVRPTERASTRFPLPVPEGATAPRQVVTTEPLSELSHFRGCDPRAHHRQCHKFSRSPYIPGARPMTSLHVRERRTNEKWIELKLVSGFHV